MKVLIAMGTCSKFSYIEEKVIKAILSQTFQNFDFLIVDNSADLIYSTQLRLKHPHAKVIHVNRPRYFRDALGQARKIIKDYAVNRNYDYLFCVDADMILQPDTLEKLLSHNVDFITGVIGYMHDKYNRTTCYIKHPDPDKIGKVPGQPALHALLFSDMEQLPERIEIVSCGLSCCLIKVRYLIGMDFFISHKQMAFLEDRIFCRDLTEKGIKLWLDTTIFPIHLHVQMIERNLRAS